MLIIEKKYCFTSGERPTQGLDDTTLNAEKEYSINFHFHFSFSNS